MKWELGALKILARNETVPGIALRDAIGEIERLQGALSKALDDRNAVLEDASKMQQRLGKALDALEYYAEESYYEAPDGGQTDAEYDHGERARAALKQEANG